MFDCRSWSLGLKLHRSAQTEKRLGIPGVCAHNASRQRDLNFRDGMSAPKQPKIFSMTLVHRATIFEAPASVSLMRVQSCFLCLSFVGQEKNQ